MRCWISALPVDKPTNVFCHNNSQTYEYVPPNKQDLTFISGPISLLRDVSSPTRACTKTTTLRRARKQQVLIPGSCLEPQAGTEKHNLVSNHGMHPTRNACWGKGMSRHFAPASVCNDAAQETCHDLYDATTLPCPLVSVAMHHVPN